MRAQPRILIGLAVALTVAAAWAVVEAPSAARALSPAAARSAAIGPLNPGVHPITGSAPVVVDGPDAGVHPIAGAAQIANDGPTGLQFGLFAQGDLTYEPAEIWGVAPGGEVAIDFTNADFTPRSHDVVFELDGGRVVKSDVIGFLMEQRLTFTAPSAAGDYPYYSTAYRDQGMAGILHVGTQPTVTAGPDITPTPAATRVPDMPWETVVGDLANPAGLARYPDADLGATLVVAEGGTGGPPPFGAAARPGNGDGRVLNVALDLPDLRDTLASGITNAQDPSGGVWGANHAIWWTMDGPATDTAAVTLVAVAGGTGHARPGDAAKVLAIGEDGGSRVIADTLAYERAHNPDGGDPGQGGLDSNPIRLVPDPTGSWVYVVDSAANVILKLDPESGSLATYAVFAPGDPGGATNPTALVWSTGPTVVGYVSLAAGFQRGQGQIRRLVDANADGDALDAGENEGFAQGLDVPMDLAFTFRDLLYVAEMASGTVRLVSLGMSGPPGSTQLVADRVHHARGMAGDPEGNLLVSAYGWAEPAGTVGSATDRIVRLPAEILIPTYPPTLTPRPGTGTPPTLTPRPGTPTATPTGTITVPGPTPSATGSVPSPTATPGTVAPPAARIYLPVAVRRARLGS